MKPQIKAKWVAALRSGEYTQAKGYLCAPYGSGHCCLGVLTDLYAKEKGIPFNYGTTDLKDGGSEMLCLTVRNWAGLKSASPEVLTENGYTQQLVNLNDGWEAFVPRSFNEIADLIEKSEL